MGRRSYSEEEKAQALGLLADASKTFYEVRDLTGVPVGTLHRWATDAGLERSDDQTKAATAARVARMAEKRTVLQEMLLDAAIDYTDSGVAQDKGTGAQAFMTAAAIALDKFRLEMGEATSRIESRDLDAAVKARHKVDDLAERRKQKTA